MHRDASEGEERIITLRKGDRASSVFFVTRVEFNQMGGAYAKNRLGGVLQKNEKRGKSEAMLVLKRVGIHNRNCFGDESTTMPPARRYYERWRYLRRLGIPTVSSMRVVDDGRVIMGDMTADGSVFFGNGKRELLEKELWTMRNRGSREITQLERVFLDIDPESIKREVASLQELAWSNGILLPVDDEYDLLVHPDGSFQVLLVDLSWLGERGDFSHDELLEGRVFLERQVDRIRNDLRELTGVGGSE